MDTRAKLSDLLEDEDQLNDFAKHCGNLLVSDEARLDDRRSESERQQMVSRWLHQLLTLTKILDRHIREYVPNAGEGTALRALGPFLTRPTNRDEHSLGGQAPAPGRPINPDQQ